MSYDAFVSHVTSSLKQRLGEEYVVQVNQITKNNSLVLDGLSIFQKDSFIAPTVYLQECYDRYRGGLPMDALLDEILSLYHAHAGSPKFTLEMLERTDFVLPHIAFRLIHRASNEQLLKTVPYRPILDLAMVCFLHLGKEGKRHLTTRITHDHLKLWEISEDDLFRIALQNTPSLFPARLCPVREAVDQMMDFPGPRKSEAPDFLYLLTNRPGIDGAAAMLYPSLLADFAQKRGHDLVILPSSVHEVLLMPTDDPGDGDGLSQLITQINRQQVPKDERLSNQAYLFSRETGQLSVLSSSAETSL